MTERCPHIQLESGNKTRALTFTANGEYLVSGDEKKVRVWRVADGEQIATMVAGLVNCLAVSKDGRFIAAGTLSGEVIVWDAQRAFRKVFTLDDHYVIGLDFSPDSSHLLTASFECTATIWDLANTREHRHSDILTLHHDEEIVAAKFSPLGDRLAVATAKLIRIYDSDNGVLLADIRAEVTPWYNTGLLWWLNDRLLIVSENKVKQIDTTTSSVVSEWPVPDSDASSCIALPQQGEFVAYSAGRTVTVWEASESHTQLDLIHHTQTIRSISISSDDRFLAIAGERGKIIIKRLPPNMTDTIPLSRLHPTFREPDFHIHEAALDSLKQGQLANAEVLLSTAIPDSPHKNHVLASRALVRARLQQWNAAIADAKESIKIRPSVLGYIAKAIALVGNGEKKKGYRACDIAFERYHSMHVSFLLLIKAVITFLAGDHTDAISRLDDLSATVRFNSICHLVQAKMYLLLGQLQMQDNKYEDATLSFERAQAKVRRHKSRPLSAVSLITGWKFDDLDITIRQQLCKSLHATGHTTDAVESFLELVETINEDSDICRYSLQWITDFSRLCLSTVEQDDEIIVNKEQHGDTSRTEPRYMRLLRKWTKVELAQNSWQDALVASTSFLISRICIYRAVCERLEALDRIADATECFLQMVSELAVEAHIHEEQASWITEFKLSCTEKLECLGDSAMTTRQYDEAISRYSGALSLEPAVPGLLIKRSQAYVAGGSWEDALNDANKVIVLDPLSPSGYERKHAALHKAGSYGDAIATFEKMRTIISQSPDPEIHELQSQYVDPEKTKTEIRRTVQNVIRDAPRVLIDTHSGRLLDKSKQASSFESLPVFKELISSMTTHIDNARIEQEVSGYYRYATFSHTWEENEPLYGRVVHVVVYDLEEHPTHDKLQMFCKIVRDAGFNWAWSDTCCIDKGDHVVLQEALVAMFKWYEGSSLTVIFLRGARSPSRRGDLIRSIWNTRAWTFQEYHASKVVRFYTEDWKPYLNLDIPNHKESPEIIEEMEKATGVAASALIALRPGLNDVREKLCLASRRQTTLVEDAAYSLLGIFSISLPVVYGEGDQAVGRLLRQLLASSGDTSILAWNGKSSSFNSCLPATIGVFEQYPPPHVPPPIEDTIMEGIIARQRASNTMKLYDRLSALPVPSFSERRLKLPCLSFKVGPVTAIRSASGCVFRAKTDALGVVEITSNEDLTRLDSLILVHPWIDFLLDRRPVGSFTKITPKEKAPHRTSSASDASSSGASAMVLGRRLTINSILRLGGQTSSSTSGDKRMQAHRLVARLRQPFGALLLTPTRHHVAEYRRVAAESMITVRVKEDTSVDALMECVRVLDVL